MGDAFPDGSVIGAPRQILLVNHEAGIAAFFVAVLVDVGYWVDVAQEVPRVRRDYQGYRLVILGVHPRPLTIAQARACVQACTVVGAVLLVCTPGAYDAPQGGRRWGTFFTLGLPCTVAAFSAVVAQALASGVPPGT